MSHISPHNKVDCCNERSDAMLLVLHSAATGEEKREAVEGRVRRGRCMVGEGGLGERGDDGGWDWWSAGLSRVVKTSSSRVRADGAECVSKSPALDLLYICKCYFIFSILLFISIFCNLAQEFPSGLIKLYLILSLILSWEPKAERCWGTKRIFPKVGSHQTFPNRLQLSMKLIPPRQHVSESHCIQSKSIRFLDIWSQDGT